MSRPHGPHPQPPHAPGRSPNRAQLTHVRVTGCLSCCSLDLETTGSGRVGRPVSASGFPGSHRPPASQHPGSSCQTDSIFWGGLLPASRFPGRSPAAELHGAGRWAGVREGGELAAWGRLTGPVRPGRSPGPAARSVLRPEVAHRPRWPRRRHTRRSTSSAHAFVRLRPDPPLSVGGVHASRHQAHRFL